jgi:DNA-binding IclR family transcriptional regulator
MAVRERGYAESREDLNRAIWAVSAPIVVTGETVATLAVAGPL